MTTKPISHQVIDEFITELSKSDILSQSCLDSLEVLLSSGKFKKEEIVKLLTDEEVGHENP